VAHITGDYRVTGATTIVRLMLRGTKMPLTELQGALPAMGVTLPSGAVVQEGVLDLELSIAGPVDKLTISGPIAARNTKLTGFDLSEKMGAIASLAGLQRVGDTLIEELTGTARMTPDGTQIDAFTLVVPAIGTLTGGGTISPQGAMSFPMLAKLREGTITSPVSSNAVNKVLAYGQASGVPFRIQGTTSNPVFLPDVGRAVKGATDQLKDAAKDPENLKKAADALSNLLRR
jgi:AsmA protein